MVVTNINTKSKYDKLIDDVARTGVNNQFTRFSVDQNDVNLIIVIDTGSRFSYSLRIAEKIDTQWELKNGAKHEVLNPILELMPEFDSIELKSFIQNPNPQSEIENLPLIFGKDETSNIVSVEVDDNGNVDIFREVNGEVTVDCRNFKFWLLTPRATSCSQRLAGSLFYRYLSEFETKKSFQKTKSICYRKKQDTFSIYDPRESYMVRSGVTYFQDMQIQDISVLSFDIETSSLNPDDGQCLMISNTFRKQGQITKKLFSLDEFDSEDAMIISWCNWFRKMNPSIVIGHNVYSFDFPYLNSRLRTLVAHGLELGRDDSEITFDTRPSKFRKDGSQYYDYFKCFIYGREIIDTWFLSIKYDFKRNYPSYKLKEIIEYEGLVKEGRVFYDASQIKNNWDNQTEREKIKQYGIDDSDDSLALFDLMIPSFFYYARSIPKSFQTINETATGSQLNSLMVRSYIQEQHSIPKASERADYQGAISLGIPDIYNNVFKIDVASLYPSIIIQYQLYNKYKDPKAHYLKLVEYFTAERLVNKKKGQDTGEQYYKAMEQAQKICINSFYGMAGAEGLVFNAPKVADAITRYGREILDTSIQWATGEPYEFWQQKIKPEVEIPDVEKLPLHHDFILGPIDTDSISFRKQDSSPFSEQEKLDLLDEINEILPEHIIFTDDGYYETIVAVKTKNYILNDGKKIKFKGSSLTDQKKEPAMLQMIKDIGNRLLTGNRDVNDIYMDYIEQSSNVTDIRNWCAKKTVTKAVLDANQPDSRLQEKKVYDVIQGTDYKEGDKIYVYTIQDGFKPVYEKGKLKYIKKSAKQIKEEGIDKLPKLETCEHSDKTTCYECNPNLYQVKMVENYILKLAEHFDGQKPDTVQSKLYGRVFKTLEIFQTIIDIKQYSNYSLKSNISKLADGFDNQLKL